MIPAIRKLFIKLFTRKLPLFPYISPASNQYTEETDNLLKGYQFESLVVSKFTPVHFILHHWRSDKRCGDIFPLSNSYPDLEYEYRDKSLKRKFAVECKWRARFIQESVIWATDLQINNYLKYHYTNDIPVFIILGIGGQASAPEELYIIPLEAIGKNQTVLSVDFLQPFKKGGPDEVFFLHPERMEIV
ncbi:MAG: hypothetical protein ABI687_08655 [Flavitalea sp.]